MKKITGIFLCLIINNILFAQNKISFLIKDAISQERLKNVSVIISRLKQGASSDSAGTAVIKNIPNGKQIFNFSSIGYKELSIEVKFPVHPVDSVFEILMEQDVKEEDQVIVASSRTESRIENTPTRVEVLGSEEVNEEVGIKPGNIASLLGDIAGIQTQQTSASTGNTEMRVQGLPGKYTQLLRDGMPLFAGYSGSFSILQIPPLDLKQIEIVKGSVSTLYGGGAIAGMINLISKKPKEGVFEKTILLNQSTLNESNINVYLSNRKNKMGYTFFTGYTRQQQVDVNKDGFSDLPHTRSYFIHPTLFLYPDKKNIVSIGYNGVYENRKGGDMLVLKNKPDNLHQYFNQSKADRHTTDINWENKISNTKKIDFKATTGLFDRSIETNVFGMKAKQLSWYSEASYLSKTKISDWVLGINFNGEDFKKKMPDSSRFKNETTSTIGAFAQNDWRINNRLTLETGLRFDHHNLFGNFVLPRFSLLYKISRHLTSRIGGGLGYKIPTVFSADIDERAYPFILPLNFPVHVKAERSAGANWDINFHKNINDWETTINQTFYVTSIKDPVIASTATNGLIYFSNAGRPITTYGFETYIQLQHDKLEIYLGYVYTVAKKLYDNINPYLSLSARNKFATVLAYEFSGKFRAGIEAAFTGKQYLDNGSRTPAYPFVAGMMRYDIKAFSFVLNCENLFDYRQTKKESIIIPPSTNPGFKQLWAPIDGRVANLSVRIKL
jgi:outer membrane receptor for ferrienterochelin and colicin